MEVNCADEFALVTDQEDAPPKSGAKSEAKAQNVSQEEIVDTHMKEYK